MPLVLSREARHERLAPFPAEGVLPHWFREQSPSLRRTACGTE